MVVLLALATMVSTGLGGLLALRAKDSLHLVLGFAAGAMLGVVAFDLLPELFGRDLLSVGGVPAPMLGLAGGFLVLHVAERSLALHHAHEGEYGDHAHPVVGTTAGVALVLHSVLDGVGIGLGFHVSRAIGVTVAIAVIAHDFADGLNTVTVMLVNGHERRRARIMLALDALAPVAGALLTYVVAIPQRALPVYLGFFAGFLLYLATSDILPEAHSRHPSRLTLVSTMAGVAFIYAVVALS